MELLVFGHAGARVLVFPTRDGRFYEYENLRIVGSIAHKIEAGHLQLFCVDSLVHETFYCWWKRPSDRLQQHIAFERYVLEEVFPLMDLVNPHECTIAHGCSLGAYYAGAIALRHPHRFRKLAAFSGRYDLTEPVEWFGDLLDGFHDENVYFHMPSQFVPNLDCPEILRHLRNMDIVLVIGEEDPFLENNRRLSESLWDKGVPNSLHVWRERAHRGYYWRRMAPLYL